MTSVNELLKGFQYSDSSVGYFRLQSAEDKNRELARVRMQILKMEQEFAERYAPDCVCDQKTAISDGLKFVYISLLQHKIIELQYPGSRADMIHDHQTALIAARMGNFASLRALINTYGNMCQNGPNPNLPMASAYTRLASEIPQRTEGSLESLSRNL